MVPRGGYVPRSLILTAALGLLSCSTGPTDQLSELDQARDRWAAQSITSYVLTLRRACFCAGPFAVEIRVSGATIIRIDVASGQPVPPDMEPYFPDIPGLFELILDEIERPAAAVTVEYDPQRGYPTSINVDQIKNAIDDEYGYTITGFRVGQ